MSTPIMASSSIGQKEYDILPAALEDKEEIVNFLLQFFFRDEPLNKYLGLVTDGDPLCKDLDENSLDDINKGKGMSLKAVYNGKIIGVCLNAVLEKDSVDKHDVSVEDPKVDKLFKLFRHVAQESKVFDKFPDCNKAMTITIISVNGAFRGRGIAKELIIKTREIAKKLGCGFMTVDCTSHFTALALKKLGFELHYSLKYSDYRDNGEIVFKPEPPHEAVTVYVQKI